MKFIKKLLVLFIVLAFSSTTSVFAFKDTQTKPYGDEAAFLSALGILNGYSADEFGGEKTLTRAELSTTLIRMLGYNEESLSVPEKKIYTDVELDHWAIKCIYKSYLLGNMTGKGDGSFKPDESVLYNEAVKVMVNALGYEEVAAAKGGYPTGYISVATGNKLLGGVNCETDGTITRGNLARLIFNTLNAYCLNVYGYDNGNALTDKNVTLMESALDIKYVKGVVRAYGDVSLNGTQHSCPDKRFLLEDAFIYEGDTKPEEHIGKNVGVYYKKDISSGNLTAVYIWDTEDENKTLNVDSELISESTTLSKLVYKKTKDTNSTLSVLIDGNAEFMYNNRLLSIKKPDDMLIKNGTIKLIDNDGDNKYDVVFINEYETYVVESVVGTSVKINTKFSKGTLSLDPEKNDISVKYYKNDEETDFTVIGANNILSVLKSKNISGTVIYRIYISDTVAEETVNETEAKSDTYVVKISDDVSYELSKDYMERLALKDPDTKVLEVGEAYAFYLDIFGKIVYSENKENIKNYGYLVYAKVFSQDFEDTAKFRIFTKNSEFIDFSSKSSINYNNVSTKSDRVVASFTDSQGETRDQLIVYKLNSENQITDIITSSDKTGDTSYVAGDDEFVLNYASDTGGLRFYKNLAENKPYVFKSSKTVQFAIPADRTREKDYKVITKLSSTDVSLPAPLKIYDSVKGGSMGAVVTGTTSSGKLSAPVIVDYVAEAIDEDGDTCKKMYFIGGSSVTFNADDVTFDVPISDSKGEIVWKSSADYSGVGMLDLEKGDVIEYTLTANNKVDMVRIIIRVSDVGKNRTDGDHIAENGNMIGDVVSVSDDKNNVVLHTIDRYGKEQYQAMFINATAYRYDSDEKEVYYSSKNEVEVGDKLLLNSYWWSCKMVYILR